MAESIIDIGNEIREKVDIVNIISHFIEVTKKGNDYVAICPFHNDTKPSLHISPEKKIFKCFSCGTSGDVIKFVRNYNNCSYVEALKTICKISGIVEPRLENNHLNNSVTDETKNILKCLKSIDDYYLAFLNTTEEGKSIGLDYLYNRGLDDSTISKFKIGYALKDRDLLPSRLLKDGYSLKIIERTGIGSVYGNSIKDNNAGRIIFTITDHENNVVGFSARQIVADNEHGKYINSPETNGGVFHKSNILYNYFNAQLPAQREKNIYLVEGFMDAIALDRVGISQVVALMGTSLTKEQIKLLQKLKCEVRLCLDNDGPGQDAMIKASQLLKSSGVNFRFVSNEINYEQKDCDEMLLKQGPEKLKEYVSNLVSEGEFILNYYSKKYDLSILANKKLLINDYLIFLKSLKDNLEVQYYIHKLSEATGFSEDSIKSELNINEPVVEVNYYEDTNNEKTKNKKFKKQINKLYLCEKMLIKYMLESKEAIKEFDATLGYFTTNVFQEISNILIEYVKDCGQLEYTIDSVVKYIDSNKNITNDKLKFNMLFEIEDINKNIINYPPYSSVSFKECVDSIENIKKNSRSMQIYKETTNTDSMKEKTDSLSRLLEDKKKMLDGK